VNYGRRDEKGTINAQQVQYGAQAQKSTNNQGEKYAQHHSSNLLHKNSKEGYFNQLYQGGNSSSSQATKSATINDSHHTSITKQQMIQNLN